MNETLLSRCFDWRTILCRKPKGGKFVKTDYAGAVNLAISQLPDDEAITEVVIETEIEHPSKHIDMVTTIYWLSR